jgi:predicted ATPase
LSAERIGPRDAYQSTVFGSSPWVGYKGEFTAQYLSKFAQTDIDEAFVKDKSFGKTLKKQTDYWLGYVMSGESFDVEQISNTGLYKLHFKDKKGGSFSPANSAFGLTYTLPIIAACLGANKENILLIENPEAHLHPSSQSRMGEFLALAVSSGVNIVIETHSDHLLNGIRKSIYNKKLKSEELAITYFDRDENGNTVISCPKVDDTGHIDHWPSGFFDQLEKDLSTLIGIEE